MTDITYVRTWQGRLYLAVVVDLFARKVAGWSMKPSLSRELAMDALLMAVWRRKSAGCVIEHLPEIGEVRRAISAYRNHWPDGGAP